MAVNVKKRGEDGVEPWSVDKLVASINKAGVPLSEAEGIANKVAEWAEQNATDGVISSTQLRDKVIESLKTDYPAEADSYQAYKKG